jgi:hypothetical protein
MRLCALSSFASAPAKTVLGFMESCSADIIRLPGASENSPTPRQVRSALSQNQTAFVEGRGGKMGATPYFVTKHSERAMRRQLFARQPSAAEVDRLVAALPDRSIVLGGRRITVFMCGELIAFNPDGSVKHGRTLQFDILANPAHTIMGRWNHLGRKLATMSRKSVALYATNNTAEHSRVTTDVRIYKKGSLVRRYSAGALAWCECEI